MAVQLHTLRTAVLGSLVEPLSVEGFLYQQTSGSPASLSHTPTAWALGELWARERLSRVGVGGQSGVSEGFLQTCLMEEGSGTEGAASWFHSQFQCATLAKHRQVRRVQWSLTEAVFPQSEVCGGVRQGYPFSNSSDHSYTLLVIKYF